MKILSHFAHASFQTNLCSIPDTAFFHMVNGNDLKSAWPEENKPSNVFEIQESDVNPADFDVLIMHRHEQMQKFASWKIKKIFVEHTAPYPFGDQPSFWKPKRKQYVDFTVFITKTNRDAWGFEHDSDCTYIRHGIPEMEIIDRVREKFVMTTTNEFISRDWCCGYNLWAQVIWPFSDVRVYGYGNDNLGKKYSRGSLIHNDILHLLPGAGVYFNPATASPIPMSLLEAMALGVPIVSTAFYEPGILLKNHVHGIISNDPTELRKGIKFMLEHNAEAKDMGLAGQKLVRELFSINTFIEKWQKVLESV